MLRCFSERMLQQLMERTLTIESVVSGGWEGKARGVHLREKAPGNWTVWLDLELQTLRLWSEVRGAPGRGHSGWWVGWGNLYPGKARRWEMTATFLLRHYHRHLFSFPKREGVLIAPREWVPLVFSEKVRCNSAQLIRMERISKRRHFESEMGVGRNSWWKPVLP